MKNYISPKLAEIIEQRVISLEQQEKYVTDLLSGINAALNRNGSTIEDQQGTQQPRIYGFMDTFITNPSNVGIGVLARMIETDDTVKASVEFKSAMMMSKIGEYEHEDKNIEEFVKAFLEDMKSPSWEGSKEAMSSHYAYGFSVSEIIWRINELNQKVPKALKTYHPSTLVFEVDPYGDVTENGIVQFTIQTTQFNNPNSIYPTIKNGWLLKNPFETPVDELMPYRIPFINNYGMIRIPKNKCVHHVNNSMLSFGSPYGKTSVRTAHLAWQLKVYFMKQMGVAGKRQASPFLWATAPHAQNKVEIVNEQGKKENLTPIEALDRILSMRQNDDSIVTAPESAGYSIQAIAATIDLQQYTQVIDFLDTRIFRAFLLPSLVMTDGSGGNRALGDKHFEMVDYMASRDARSFCETLINQLIQPAIEMNFGSQDKKSYKKKYGSFTERPQSLEERRIQSEIFMSLVNGGVMRAFDKKDGEFIRKSLHLPPQDEAFYSQPMPNFPPVKDDDLDNDLNKDENDKE